MSILNDDEGPKDWEVKDEETPECLQKKWDQEEVLGPGAIVCPSCKKETPTDGLSCIFCSATIPRGNCSVSFFSSWFKKLFKKR